MRHGGDEHRPPGGFITPNVGHRLYPRFSSLCRSGCERSEFPDILSSPFNTCLPLEDSMLDVRCSISDLIKPAPEKREGGRQRGCFFSDPWLRGTGKKGDGKRNITVHRRER